MSMETKHGPGQPPPSGPSEGYEHSDANPRGLLHSGAWLLAVMVVVFVSMAWLFNFYGKVQSLGKPASPFENARVLPPAPRLQVEPRAELHAYCEEQAKLLDSYGWADEHNGVVRIPVDRAMELTLQQGLPSRAASRYSGRRSATLRHLCRTLLNRIRTGRADTCWSGIRITK